LGIFPLLISNFASEQARGHREKMYCRQTRLIVPRAARRNAWYEPNMALSTPTIVLRARYKGCYVPDSGRGSVVADRVLATVMLERRKVPR
jgi:hypothetical protein